MLIDGYKNENLEQGLLNDIERKKKECVQEGQKEVSKQMDQKEEEEFGELRTDGTIKKFKIRKQNTVISKASTVEEVKSGMSQNDGLNNQFSISMKLKTATLAQISDNMDVYIKWTRFKGKENEQSFKSKSYSLNLQTHQVDFSEEVLKIPETMIEFNDATQQYEEQTMLQIKDTKKGRNIG